MTLTSLQIDVKILLKIKVNIFSTDDVDWTQWTAFGPCSLTCGSDAVKKRTRNCHRQSGRPCSGFETESKNCELIACPGN